MKLLPYRYLHRPVGIHERDITRVEETLLVDGLLRQLGMAEVAGNDTGTLLRRSAQTYAEAHLASADAGLAVVLFVRAEVVHVRNIRQTEVAATHGAAHMAHSEISSVLEKRSAGRLGRTVSLDDLIPKNTSKEGENFR